VRSAGSGRVANQQPVNLSSVFDDMLTQSKKQFDDLYRGSHGGMSAAGKTGAAIFGGETMTPAPSRPLSVVDTKDDSPAARRLRERFGNEWRYEISERHREGDEAIVLGKLTFGKQSAVRTQFGRAKISSVPVAGASSGIQFRIAEESGARDEQDAFRRAAAAALANCVDLI
jgi:hypothetical protein